MRQSKVRPRTIQIFLPTGDPSGIRVSELTSSIVRLIEVPRSDLDTFYGMPESRQVGVYFLVGGENSDEVYVGKSGEVGVRLYSHHAKDVKDWDRALILVSLTNNLTETHILYLESLSIEKAKNVNRFDVSNSNGGQNPHIPEPMKADCDEVHEVGSLLLATLGYPFFEPLTDRSIKDEENIFYCTRSGVKARGIYTNEGMVVLEGSTAPFETKRKSDPRNVNKRDQLLEKGVLERINDRVVLKKDQLFKTPSGASSFLLLAPSNGWSEWKDKNGNTLSDIYRNIEV